MALYDLTTLTDLKTWLKATSDDTSRDDLLSSLISQVSRAIFNYINRGSVTPTTITEYYSGNGASRLMLMNWPVIKILSLEIDGASVPLSESYSQPGYILDQSDSIPPGSMQCISLRGYRFTKGVSNVTVVYTFGHQQLDDVYLISDPPLIYNIVGPYGKWASDVGVKTYPDGVPFTKMPAGTSLGENEYSEGGGGSYVFNQSLVGFQVAISYGYIPADLALAALQWCAYIYAAKDRVGQTSKSLGGQETVSFTNEAIPVAVQQTLQNYKRVF